MDFPAHFFALYRGVSLRYRRLAMGLWPDGENPLPNALPDAGGWGGDQQPHPLCVSGWRAREGPPPHSFSYPDDRGHGGLHHRQIIGQHLAIYVRDPRRHLGDIPPGHPTGYPLGACRRCPWRRRASGGVITRVTTRVVHAAVSVARSLAADAIDLGTLARAVTPP